MDTPVDQQKIDEWARMTLPIMTKQSIPVTPENYAVWYSYITGKNKSLKSEIDALLLAKKTITNELNEALFLKHIAQCDVTRFAEVRGEVANILKSVGTSLDTVGSDSEIYSNQLGSISNSFKENIGVSDLKAMLVTLITETRSMQQSTQLLKKDFDEKTKEISVLQKELERERVKATTDPLTNLANRSAFVDALTLIDESNTNCLIMLDIDNFKEVNDTYGHVIGDRVIRFISKILKDNIKGQDTAARYGGEEFAVLLPSTSLEGATAVAENIRQTVAEAKLVKSGTKEFLGQVTVSLGIAIHQSGENSMAFVNRADQALYHSKHTGRNKISTEIDL